MKVRECMTVVAKTTHLGDTVQHVAQIMRDAHIGFLPIVNLGGAPMGVVTDRDLAMRVIAEGLPTNLPICKVMSDEILCIDENSPVEDAVALMRACHVGRLVVTDSLNHVTGIFSIGDAAATVDDDTASAALMETVSRHRHTVHA